MEIIWIKYIFINIIVFLILYASFHIKIIKKYFWDKLDGCCGGSIDGRSSNIY